MPGHLSTTPRLLKAADAFSRAGYTVRVVSAASVDWACNADAVTASTRPWQWDVVQHDRESAVALNSATGLRRRTARALARAVGPSRATWWMSTRALSRAHDELVGRALSAPFDVAYGGSIGGLAVVEEAARRRGVPFGVDLEDLHTAENTGSDAALYHGLARRVLRQVLSRARFVTTSSDDIAESYRDEFGVRPTVIHNVFPLPEAAPSFERADGPLRLYWFSQTIGPGRGIEDAVEAAGYAGVPVELTLRGRSADGFVNCVLDDARRKAPQLRITVAPPAPPDQMVALCAGHDVGLSGEDPVVRNRQLCLGNKIFTYLAAGLPVALSDTTAHRRLAAELGDAAHIYPAHEPRQLAHWLAALARDATHLRARRRAAWQAAVQRWHWSHPLEEGALLDLLARAVA